MATEDGDDVHGASQNGRLCYAETALTFLGVGADAAVLGYRLFNFWLPIPLAAIFYPTFGRGAERSRA